MFTVLFSDAEIFDNVFESVCAETELCGLFVGKRNVYLATYAVVTDKIECAEANVVYTVFSVHHCGDCHRCVYSCKQALADVAYGN